MEGGGGDDKALEVLWLDELWCVLSSFGNACFVFFASVVATVVGVASVVSVVEISLLDFALFVSFVL